MKYNYYIYENEYGHPLVTPHGKAITEKEYREHFSIICDWLKEKSERKYLEINPRSERVEKCPELVEKISDGILWNTDIKEHIFFDPRILSLFYVLSYYVQKEGNKISGRTAHIYARLVREWLYVPHLEEYYLIISAYSFNKYCLDDNQYLVSLYNPGGEYYRTRELEDIDEAVKHATYLYEKETNQHTIDNLYDLTYAKVLFKKDKSNADTCLKIVNDYISRYGLISIEENSNIFGFLALGLEISSQVKSELAKFDLEEIEKILDSSSKYSSFVNQCYFHLGKCYIAGLNNEKDTQRGIDVLSKKIRSHEYSKKAGVELATLYFKGDGVDIDYDAAIRIAKYTIRRFSKATYISDEDDKKLFEIISLCKEGKKKTPLLAFISRILQKPVCYFDQQKLFTVIKKYLTDEEYEYLLYYLGDNTNRDLELGIIRKLSNPSVTRRINRRCNNVIYIGNNKRVEQFLNPDELGNMLVYGSGDQLNCYFDTLVQSMSGRVSSSKGEIMLYTKDEYSFNDKFIDTFNSAFPMLVALERQFEGEDRFLRIVCIDELYDFYHSMNDDEKARFIKMVREAKERDLVFIMGSKRMDELVEVFGEYAETRMWIGIIDSKKTPIVLNETIEDDSMTSNEAYVSNDRVFFFSKKVTLY